VDSLSKGYIWYILESLYIMKLSILLVRMGRSLWAHTGLVQPMVGELGERVNGVMSRLAAILWSVMVGIRARQVLNGDHLAILLALQAALVAYRLVQRREARAEAPWIWRLMAWTSAFMPLAVRPNEVALVPSWVSGALIDLGMVLALWALASLGSSFGIAPADRGLVNRGPYRWLRHPAYTGELISVVGYVLRNMCPWNLGLILLLAASLVARIRKEEGLIESYDCYAEQVRWRLVPGVW
jgi:protein-S-isoprenylcysteine O-methyltransferase Ste14